MSVKPTVEAIRALGSEDRLKELAAAKNNLEMLALHMLCAHPDVSVDAVRFVFPVAAAVPVSPPLGYFNGAWGERFKLALHILCQNSKITKELAEAVFALYPAAVFAKATFSPTNLAKLGLSGDFTPHDLLQRLLVYSNIPFAPRTAVVLQGEFLTGTVAGSTVSKMVHVWSGEVCTVVEDAGGVELRVQHGAGTYTAERRYVSANDASLRTEIGAATAAKAAMFAELEKQAKTPEAQAKSAEIEKQLKALRDQQAEREVEAMFGPDGGATFVEGRFKSPITVTDAHLPFLVLRLHAAVEINFSARVTDISTVGVGCPELVSLTMCVACSAPP